MAKYSQRAIMALALLTAIGGCSTSSPDEAQPPEASPGDSSYFETYQRDMAETLGIEDPPDVEFVRYITPQESVQVVNDCLEAEGWQPTEDSSGTSFQYPADQQEAFNLASYVCSVKYPVEQKYMEPLSDHQARLLYDHYVEALIPCLEQEGYEISAAPPSFEVFRADPTQWNPIDEIEPQLSSDITSGKYASYAAFEQTCPQAPSDELLYGKP